MRLLDTRTQVPEDFGDEERPEYAILSHRWSKEEVTFQELRAINEHHSQAPPNTFESKEGYTKIKGFCEIAERDGFKWVWIDTCCIDKSNNAELSEAINSMFRWYQESVVCYVYLQDVPEEDDDHAANNSSFRRSQWFTRGWTLQELIAPRAVLFMDSSWGRIGDWSVPDLRTLVAEITGIPEDLFSHRRLEAYSIAQRMSWASKRTTTRIEDLAYCLLGIFDVNMPLIYGERHKAFYRLQEEIIRQSDDQSIFAWGFKQGEEDYRHDDTNHGDTTLALAQGPCDFSHCQDIIPCVVFGSVDPFNRSMNTSTESFEISKNGIRIELLMLSGEPPDSPTRLKKLGILGCRMMTDPSSYLAISLYVAWRISGPRDAFRVPGSRPRLIRLNYLSSLNSALTTVYMRTLPASRGPQYTAYLMQKYLQGSVVIHVPPSLEYKITSQDVSLSTVIRDNQIFIHKSFTPDSTAVSSKIIVSCWNTHFLTSPNEPDSFNIAVELSSEWRQIASIIQKSSAARFIAESMRGVRVMRSVRAIITASGPSDTGSSIFERLSSVRWGEVSVDDHLTIMARIRHHSEFRIFTSVVKVQSARSDRTTVWQGIEGTRFYQVSAIVLSDLAAAWAIIRGRDSSLFVIMAAVYSPMISVTLGFVPFTDSHTTALIFTTGTSVGTFLFILLSLYPSIQRELQISYFKGLTLLIAMGLYICSLTGFTWIVWYRVLSFES